MAIRFLLIFSSFFLFPLLALSQSSWELRKVNSGIKIWTANAPGSIFKTCKAEMTIDADFEKVKKLLMDINTIAYYYEGVSKVTDIEWIADNKVQYVLEFDGSWLDLTTKAKVIRHITPVEVGSYEVRTTLVFSTNPDSDSKPLKGITSLWILINAGYGKTFVKHIEHIELFEKTPTPLTNTEFIESTFTTFTNFRKLLE